MLSFFLAPKGTLKRIDSYRSRFLWQEDEGQKKKIYHLVNWKIVCLPRDQGGLGILALGKMNYSLLGKWLVRLHNDDGVWQ